MLHALAVLADGTPSPNTPAGVILSLIVALTAFLGALGGLVAVLPKIRRGRPVPTPVPAPPPIALNSDNVDDVEDDAPFDQLSADHLRLRLRLTRKRVRVLETFLIRAKYDPSRIETGRETLTDVKF